MTKAGEKILRSLREGRAALRAADILDLPEVQVRLRRNLPKKPAKIAAAVAEVKRRARRLDAYVAFEGLAVVASDLYPKPERDDD